MNRLNFCGAALTKAAIVLSIFYSRNKYTERKLIGWLMLGFLFPACNHARSEVTRDWDWGLPGDQLVTIRGAASMKRVFCYISVLSRGVHGRHPNHRAYANTGRTSIRLPGNKAGSCGFCPCWPTSWGTSIGETQETAAPCSSPAEADGVSSTRK